MDNVFIILKNVDDWRYGPYAIGFTDSKESAEAICSKLDSYHTTAKEVGKKVREILKPIYDEELNLESQEIWPKWPAGIAQKDITHEMRAEREEIQKANKEKADRNSAKFAEHRARINSAVVEFINKLDYDADLMEYIRKHVEGGWVDILNPYSYEEVKKIS